jgi:uncharacterized protein YkwD
MKRLSTILLSFLLCLPVFSQSGTRSAVDDFGFYKEMNNRESGLIEYKDNDEELKIKLRQLDIINKSRRKYRVPVVKLDILASRVANKTCKEAGENNFISHWNMAGEKPYHRYAFSGGHDHVAENVYGEWTTGEYDTSLKEIAGKMESGHASFMAERAPNDGHKKTILNKMHNYVGIGFYVSEKQFRYNEEFIDRYLEFESIPSRLKINETGNLTIRTDGSAFLFYLVAFREKIPAPMTLAQLKKTGSYEDFSKEEYLKMTGWELAKRRDGNIYHIPLKFSKEGLYYIHIYLDKKEITKPMSFNTKGKTEGSGIVIRVE